MTTNNLLKECATILRGEHKAWEGDSILNAESYLRRFAKDCPNLAHIVADDIAKNLHSASEISGLHPNRCQWIVNRIREYNTLDHVSNFGEPS